SRRERRRSFHAPAVRHRPDGGSCSGDRRATLSLGRRCTCGCRPAPASLQAEGEQHASRGFALAEQCSFMDLCMGSFCPNIQLKYYLSRYPELRIIKVLLFLFK
ncbi:hypothetical protein H1C71_005489, partial [Ictidomys tridecemlineatus]